MGVMKLDVWVDRPVRNGNRIYVGFGILAYRRTVDNRKWSDYGLDASINYISKLCVFIGRLKSS